ncbi:hypothetical protein ACHAWO_013345 [Cyclotella atomus]|uniref:Ribosomal protein eL8/eL30/eS12/Gadd45 domain-containing protein n=1 Tax=Cyclotella atomus TaxID=382360 RepID=A0ABD3P5Q9_9STRA
MTSHSNKKKRSLPPQQHYPQKYSSRLTVDDEDISRISYPFASGGAIVTPIVPFDVKGMVFERLKEELLPKLNGRWNRTCRLHNTGDEDKIKTTAAETVVRSRLIIGINQCTQMLEKVLQQKKQNKFISSEHTMPSLIILTRDARPATIFSHIPIYAHLLKIPILILPGKASVELGRLLGLKSIAALVFLSSGSKVRGESTDEEASGAHTDVDSFVNFVISKIPK